MLVVLVFFLAGLLMLGIAIFQNNLPLTSPPGLMERLRIYLTTNIAVTSADPLLPEMQVRAYPDNAESLYEASINAIKSLGWEVASQDSNRREIHALVTTPLWSFVDDVMIRIEPDEGSRNTVHLQSSSRKGRGDLGTNSRHILDFYHALEHQVQ